MTSEERAPEKIDVLLTASGWVVQIRDNINLSVGGGVAVGELSFARGEPDYTQFVNGKALGAVKAKPDGFPPIGADRVGPVY
jgi:hypothetical protein